MRRTSKLLFALVLLFLSGCWRVPLRDLAKYQPADPVDSARVEDWLQRESESLEGFRLLHRGVVSGGLQKAEFRQAVVFSSPDKLRLEIFATGANQLTAMVVATNDYMTIYKPSSKAAYRGAASRETLSQVLRVSFTVDELAHWLVARKVVADDDKVRFLTRDGGASYLAAWESDERREYVELVPSSDNLFRMVAYDVEQGAQVTLKTRYFYQNESAVFPNRIEFEFPQEGASFKLMVQRERMNPGVLREQLFRIQIPSSIYTQSLSRAGDIWAGE